MEELIIYKKYLDLMFYSNEILKKYPKSERQFLAGNINNTLNQGIRLIILAYKEYYSKLKYLNELDASLKILKVYIRISYRYKYINKRNYEVFSRKITDISNILGAWIKSCQKH